MKHNKTTTIPIILVLFLMLLAVPAVVSAQSPPPYSDFFGTVFIDGTPAPIGTVVEVFLDTETLCGSFTIHKEGVFGYLSCVWRDRTPQDIALGDQTMVIFTVDGIDAQIIGNATWIDGALTKLKLLSKTIVLPTTETPRRGGGIPAKLIWYVLLSFVVSGSALYSIFYFHKKKKK